MSNTTNREKAFINISNSIKIGKQFPDNIFSEDWDAFLFFDSDWIFDVNFVEIAKGLLLIENAQCICLNNLDASQSFYFEEATSATAYKEMLNGPTAGEGWIYGVDRFACVSNKGEWCIYCERRSEIAVIAIKKKELFKKYEIQLARIKALPIDAAIKLPLSYGFSERALSKEWQHELSKQYNLSFLKKCIKQG